jgi:hypothetical protein
MYCLVLCCGFAGIHPHCFGWSLPNPGLHAKIVTVSNTSNTRFYAIRSVPDIIMSHPPLSSFHLFTVVRPVGLTAKFFKTTLQAVYGREIIIQLSGNSFGGHSCSQHANCTQPSKVETLHLSHLADADICGIVLCDKTAHFKVAFYCPHRKVHLCKDHDV